MGHSAQPPRPVSRRRKQPAAGSRQAERDFSQQIVDAATLLGWRCYRTWNSRHSPAGFPDLVLIHPPRLVVAELKRDGEQPTPAQWAWLEAFRDCGLEACVWTPADWAEVRAVLERKAAR